MKFVNPKISKKFILEENVVNIIVIERASCFANFINKIYDQYNGNEGNFILSDNEKILEFSKHIELITDLFSIDLNHRKIINKLYAKLVKESYETEIIEYSNKLISDLVLFIEKVKDNCGYSLSYTDEFQLAEIFKFVNLKFEINYENIIEKIIDYLDIMSEICNIKVFFFVNLKCFLNDEEVKALYKYIEYKKLHIVLLENTERSRSFEQEKIYVLDKDLCEIY